MAFPLTIDDGPASLEITGRAPFLKLRIDGREHEIQELAQAAPGTFGLLVDGRPVRGFRYVNGDEIWIRLGGRTFVIGRSAAGARARQPGDRDELRADMPGTVVAIHVREGQDVRAGDPLVTIESMKLQLSIAADHDATVASILVRENATFERGAVLVVLGPKTESP